MDTFGFGQFSPGVNFMLMPASYDVLKMQAIEFNDQIRKSTFSFELVNNKLKLFPVPTVTGSLIFEYYKNTDKEARSMILGFIKLARIIIINKKGIALKTSINLTPNKSIFPP